jgi:LPXTG-site transpeptidase (sortase) family protein
MKRIRFGAIIMAFLILFGCSSNASLDHNNAAPEQPAPEPASYEPAPPEEATAPQPGKLSPQLEQAFRADLTALPTLEEVQRRGIVPARLQIPAIGVDAEVEHVGLLENGEVGVPSSFDGVGWLKTGAKPGEAGNAVIDGHEDHYTGPAVFYDLVKLKPGDEVLVSDKNGNTVTFVVKNTAKYKTAEAPLEDIFGFTTKAQLNLITCAGRFNRETKESEERLVVYTELKE